MFKSRNNWLQQLFKSLFNVFRKLDLTTPEVDKIFSIYVEVIPNKLMSCKVANESLNFDISKPKLKVETAAVFYTQLYLKTSYQLISVQNFVVSFIIPLA